MLKASQVYYFKLFQCLKRNRLYRSQDPRSSLYVFRAYTRRTPNNRTIYGRQHTSIISGTHLSKQNRQSSRCKSIVSKQTIRMVLNKSNIEFRLLLFYVSCLRMLNLMCFYWCKYCAVSLFLNVSLPFFPKHLCVH